MFKWNGVTVTSTLLSLLKALKKTFVIVSTKNEFYNLVYSSHFITIDYC